MHRLTKQISIAWLPSQRSIFSKPSRLINPRAAAAAYMSSGTRNWIAKDGRFPPEAGRYHLYVSYACPWASRALSAYYMKGLEDVIGLSVVHPIFQRTRPELSHDEHFGWAFGDAEEESTKRYANKFGFGQFATPSGVTQDTANHVKFIRDLYEKAQVKDASAFSVPILWDKKENVIVNNESADLLRMLNNEFNELAKHSDVDLYPEALRAKIDAANVKMGAAINSGVYKCGFAKSQGEYEAAIHALYQALDHFEEVLSQQRYVTGSSFTEADIRLFVSLIRFDEVYVVHYKTNRKTIQEYPNLFNYVKDIYQIPAIQRTVNMEHIKLFYYGSQSDLNKFGIVPVGPSVEFHTPHDRARFG